MEKNINRSGRMKKNEGINLLKLLSMYFVCILHVVGQGGVLKSVTFKDMDNYMSAWLIEMLCFVAVNCFGLISGYVGVYSKMRYKKIIRFYIQVTFYCVVITLMMVLTGKVNASPQLFLRAIMPITHKEYWYMSSYLGLMFLMPLLNKALQGMSFKELKIYSNILIGVFTIYKFWGEDPFEIQSGYSMLWLVILYTLGGMYRVLLDHGAQRGTLKNLYKYFSYIIISWGLVMILSWYSVGKADYILGEGRVCEYNSIFILLASINLFLFFENISVNDSVIKVIRFLMPMNLSVYLIHNHPLMVEYILKDRFCEIAHLSAVNMIIRVLIIAVLVYVLCIGIDYVRIIIFEKIYVYNRKHKNFQIIIDWIEKISMNGFETEENQSE